VIALVLAVVFISACAAAAVVLVLRLLPTVRLQLAGLALTCVVLPLLAVLLSGWVMFGMGADVKILVVSSAAAVAAIGAGLVLGRSLGMRLDRLRHATREFAGGDLGARTEVEGPAELTELAGAFNHMASRLADLFDSRSELVAWASHDLRTPIASLKAMVEALEDGVAEPEEFLPALRSQVQTLETLIEDLFEVALLDAGALRLDLRETELTELVRECLEGLRPEVNAAGISLEQVAKGPAPAVCAPEKVERVLRNLVANALRHTPKDGSIVVSVTPTNGDVRVLVEDTGEGLTPDAEQRMFDRFWRADAARTTGTAGAGLGLTIAQGLVKAQGGEIWAESQRSGGTTVGFTLPRCDRS
jgi:two-component system, OmpR family, sensor histidine kinase SaeS